MFVVFLDPLGHSDFLCIELGQNPLFIRRLHPEVQFLVGCAQSIENGAVKQTVELFRRQAQAIPLRPALLQLLAASQQQLCVIAFLGGQTRLGLDPAGQ